jgi:hypothetical protein
MQYQLKIYGPKSNNGDDYIKVFTSTAPFLPFRSGDLLNASAWGLTGSKLLRVLNVEHVISEKSVGGIDPSGRIIDRALVYTERAVDSAETRHELRAPSYLSNDSLTQEIAN